MSALVTVVVLLVAGLALVRVGFGISDDDDAAPVRMVVGVLLGCAGVFALLWAFVITFGVLIMGWSWPPR